MDFGKRKNWRNSVNLNKKIMLRFGLFVAEIDPKHMHLVQYIMQFIFLKKNWH